MTDAADGRHWVLPPEVFDMFVELMEEEPRDLPKLVELFRKPTPFTKDCE